MDAMSASHIMALGTYNILHCRQAFTLTHSRVCRNLTI